MDAEYADDITLLTNTPAQTETLLHSLERAAAGIGLHVNAEKTEYMCFSQRGDISTLNGSSLKLVPRKQCLLNQERHQHVTSKGIDMLSVIWKLNMTDKIKRSFFPSSGHVDTAIWMHNKDSN